MGTISGAAVTDLRFPTSRSLDGSDAINLDPDYSAAYLELFTSDAGRYRLPARPGASTAFAAGIERAFAHPHGTEWHPDATSRSTPRLVDRQARQ